MKLFLSSASNAIKLLESKLPKKKGGIKVLFIANASDNYSGEKWWVEADKNAFEEIGCVLTELDLRITNRDSFVSNIESADIIHFSGGSVLYLIELIKKQKLKDDISKYVKEGKIIYSGTSAGSMIASHDLSLSIYDDEDKEYVKGMSDFKGLSLVNFLIIPHTNNKDFVKSNIQMIEHLSEHLQSLIFINDEQAVWVENNKFELLNL